VLLPFGPDTSLLWGTVLLTVGCLVAFLTSTPYVLVAFSPQCKNQKCLHSLPALSGWKPLRKAKPLTAVAGSSIRQGNAGGKTWVPNRHIWGLCTLSPSGHNSCLSVTGGWWVVIGSIDFIKRPCVNKCFPITFQSKHVQSGRSINTSWDAITCCPPTCGIWKLYLDKQTNDSKNASQSWLHSAVLGPSLQSKPVGFF
jgi:hypothetical protein